MEIWKLLIFGCAFFIVGYYVGKYRFIKDAFYCGQELGYKKGIVSTLKSVYKTLVTYDESKKHWNIATVSDIAKNIDICRIQEQEELEKLLNIINRWEDWRNE